MYFKEGIALLIGTSSDDHIVATSNNVNSLSLKLKDPNIAGYLASNVFELPNQNATKTNIIRDLNQIHKISNESSTVLIFYSGHGEIDTTTPDARPYLVTNENGSTTNRLYVDEFIESIKDLKYNKLLLMVDSCFSQGFTNNVELSTNRVLEKFKTDLSTGAGNVIISSSQENQRAWILSGENYTIFGKRLLEVFEGINSKGPYVTLSDLLSYLPKVTEDAETIGQSQNPNFKGQFTPPIFIAKNKSYEIEPSIDQLTEEANNFDGIETYLSSEQLNYKLEKLKKDTSGNLAYVKGQIKYIESIINFRLEKGLDKIDHLTEKLAIKSNDISRKKINIAQLESSLIGAPAVDYPVNQMISNNKELLKNAREEVKIIEAEVRKYYAQD